MIGIVRVVRGLFLVFVAVSVTAGLSGQEEEPVLEVELLPIEVRMETNPVNPTVNNPWSVFILVNHPRPDEVSVESSDFPASLALERIRTDTRTFSSGADNQSERWTRVEFLFVPRRAETVRLEPFEVRIFERLALTAAVNARVQSESTGRYEPRFRWVSPPAGIRLGEAGELTLELTNWDPARRTPEDFFRGRAPLNAILDENPPERTEAGTYRYRIVLIPLDNSSVKLSSFSFYSDTYTLSVPEISLSILPARQVAVAAPALDEIRRDEIPDDISFDASPISPKDYSEALSFPLESEEVFFLFRKDYRRIVARVETLWKEDLLAEALAEIRKSERDSPAGPYLVPIRREMEEALGLNITEDERWRPFVFSLFSFTVVCLVLVFAVALLTALKNKNVTSRRRRGFIVVIVCTLILGLIFIFPKWEFFQVGNSERSGRIAVLKETQSYRVPDYKGAVNDRFSEGQPVTVGDFRGEWCFAETMDGRSGWVERESVIIY